MESSPAEFGIELEKIIGDVGIVFFGSKRKLNKNKQTKILFDMHFVVLR